MTLYKRVFSKIRHFISQWIKFTLTSIKCLYGQNTRSQRVLIILLHMKNKRRFFKNYSLDSELFSSGSASSDSGLIPPERYSII